MHLILALLGLLGLIGGVGVFINATTTFQKIVGVAVVGLGLALWALATAIDSVKTGRQSP